MKKDFLEHLRIIAGVNHHSISEQHLELLKLKYDLSDIQMNELRHYCAQHSIGIYNEATSLSDTFNKSKTKLSARPKTSEQTIRDESIGIVANRIMHVAVIKARKRTNDKGWICGTYTNSLRKHIRCKVSHTFDDAQLKYIISHLPAKNNADTAFYLYDKQDPSTCDYLTNFLNSLIPNIHVNSWSYIDYL